MINSDYTQGKKWFKKWSLTVRSKHIRLFSFTIIFKLYIIYETKYLTAIVTVNLSSIFPLLWCRKWSSTQKNEDIPWRGTSSCRQLFRLSGCGMSSSPWKWVKRAKEGHIIYDLKKKRRKKYCSRAVRRRRWYLEVAGMRSRHASSAYEPEFHSEST